MANEKIPTIFTKVSVENCAARLVTRTRSSEHITPVLRRLHWPPVRQRITYKILLLTNKALNGIAPKYIADLLQPYRVFSLTWPAYMQIYWNKRKRLHKKRVQLPEDWFGTPTWPPFHCFGTPIWPP